MPLEGVLPVSLLHLFTEPDIENTKMIKQESYFGGRRERSESKAGNFTASNALLREDLRWPTRDKLQIK